jgi:hypothetical protein
MKVPRFDVEFADSQKIVIHAQRAMVVQPWPPYVGW